MVSEHCYFLVYTDKGVTFRTILQDKWPTLLDHFQSYVLHCNKRYPSHSKMEILWERSWSIGEDTPEFDYKVLDLAYMEHRP